MLFAPRSCLCDCNAGGGAMARQTGRITYEQRKAQILAALEANGPMFNPELTKYLGEKYHTVRRATARMEDEEVLVYGTRGSVAGWVAKTPAIEDGGDLQKVQEIGKVLVQANSKLDSQRSTLNSFPADL